MGQHKHNSTAIKAKNGELPPKKPKISKREAERLLNEKINSMLGIDKIRGTINCRY